MADAPAPFHIKDFNNIVQDMILTARAHTERVTDYNIGSVARTLLEAPGLEIDALYQAMYYGLLDAIPIAIYEGFGFSALPAMAASGYVVFTLNPPASTDTLVPAGTLIRAPGAAMTWATQVAATIRAGATTVTVRIAATSTGTTGNRAAHELLGYEVTASASLTVDNPQPIGGGRDAESAEERRLRFIRYIQSLARGTPASLIYIAGQAQLLTLDGLVMERAQRIAVEETPGHVNLWVWNGHGQTSNELCAAIARLVEGYWDEDSQRSIPGYRPAGMRVDVHPMADYAQDVTIELDAARGDRIEAALAAARAAIAATILAEPVNTLLRPVELLGGVLTLPGVLGARLHHPTEAVTIPPYTALVPGKVVALWNPELVG